MVPRSSTGRPLGGPVVLVQVQARRRHRGLHRGPGQLRPIECAKGPRVLADHSWNSAPEIDVLVYPGGSEFDELLAIDGSIEARPEARFVDEGDVITAAGISAGVDMALYLIVRLHSEDRAREIKRRLRYEPDPPV
jgi:putative intracellular protease/amidase